MSRWVEKRPPVDSIHSNLMVVYEISSQIKKIDFLTPEGLFVNYVMQKYSSTLKKNLLRKFKFRLQTLKNL